MLYALVSDLHANMPAWRAVLADLSSVGAQRIICLGDIVGYGPEPAAVLESVYRHVDAFVMGNHDAVLCGKMEPSRFNSHARTMIEWSTARISRRGREFLAQQSLVLTGTNFCCVHGDLALPAAFRYISEPQDAIASWEAVKDPLIFVGHTHMPCLFVRGASGVPHQLPPQDFVLEEGKRFVVNVGSVGYPRDGDARACYVLYDSDDGSVRWRRVPYDMELLRGAMVRAGLTEEQMPLLGGDPLRRRRPVREALQFDPAVTMLEMAHGVTISRDLTTLRRRLHYWRLIAAAGLLLALLATALVLLLLLSRPRPSGKSVPPQPLRAREVVVANDLLSPNLLPPIPVAIANERLGEWRYSLSDPKVQQIAIANSTGPNEHAPRLLLTNKRHAQIRLEAPMWRLEGLANGKLRAELLIRRGQDFKGSVKVVVDGEGNDLEGRPRSYPDFLHFIPNMVRKGGWEKGQQTSGKPLDASMQSLAFRIEADFEGTLELAEPLMRML